MTIFHNF